MSSAPQGEERQPSGTAPGSAERSPRGDPARANLSQIHLRPLPIGEALGLLKGPGQPGGPRWYEDYPMAETLGALSMLVAAHEAAGWSMQSEPAWWLHQIVLGDVVVGDVGFHGPPAASGPVEVEIGYNVVEGLRSRGIATCACRLLLEVAWRDGADAVRAEADQVNEASKRVLLRSGFTDLGGLQYVVRRPREVSR